MYEEIVSALRNCGFPNSYRYCPNCVFAGKYGGSCDLKKLLPEAADAIEELSRLHEAQRQNLITLMNEEPETKWIPVTERLPECEWGAEVGNIEWISCGMVFAGCFGRGGKYRDAYFRTWTDVTEGIDAKDADYWRPIRIPEPPEEE